MKTRKPKVSCLGVKSLLSKGGVDQVADLVSGCGKVQTCPCGRGVLGRWLQVEVLSLNHRTIEITSSAPARTSLVLEH